MLDRKLLCLCFFNTVYVSQVLIPATLHDMIYLIILQVWDFCTFLGCKADILLVYCEMCMLYKLKKRVGPARNEEKRNDCMRSSSDLYWNLYHKSIKRNLYLSPGSVFWRFEPGQSHHWNRQPFILDLASAGSLSVRGKRSW